MVKKTTARDKLPPSAPVAKTAATIASRKTSATSPARPRKSDAVLSADAGRPEAARRPMARQDQSELAKSKPKLVRDSFTIPKDEYAKLEALKSRSISLARPAKKSELLRAGIAALHAMSDARLLAALGAVPSLKTGRPKRSPDDQNTAGR